MHVFLPKRVLTGIANGIIRGSWTVAQCEIGRDTHHEESRV